MSTYQPSLNGPPSAALRGELGVLQHPGLKFWGPQLVGVDHFYVVIYVCKRPGPALALMRPWVRRKEIGPIHYFSANWISRSRYSQVLRAQLRTMPTRNDRHLMT